MHPLAAIPFILWTFSAAAIAQSEGTVGPTPRLPLPEPRWLPTTNIAPAHPWGPGEHPTPAAGLTVRPYAQGLDHPRWLFALPNGDVLVAETNAPAKEGGGLMAWMRSLVMKRAGASTASANRLTLLRDLDGDGIAETRTRFLDGLNSPFGMALVKDSLYVANADALVKLPYVEGATEAAGPVSHVLDLPAGRNHHWTKNVIASGDGRTLYVTVGSNSNVAEHGMDEEQGRAAIWAVDVATGAHRIYADGLRNPNGMAWGPEGSSLWTVVNERDELGDDVVPDYLSSVQDGGFYGWPYSYWGVHLDARAMPPRPDRVATAITPDYALGSHVAPLGLAASNASQSQWPQAFQRGMFVGLHGSWNRKELAGYKVVFVPFDGPRPVQAPRDVLTDFLDEQGRARGRPVGVLVDARGGLLVADDVGNTVWRVAPSVR